MQGFMQHYWMQWIQKARLNAVDFMQHGPKHPDGMQWIPWSIIECRVFNALCRNGSRLYAVESMQCDKCMDSRQPGKIHPDWMQWIPCSLVKCIPIECRGFHALWRNGSRLYAAESMQRDDWMDSMQLIKMHPDWIQWIPWSLNECEDSKHCGAMDPDCMQWSPCSVMNAWIPVSLVKCIPIECSGFHAAWLSAVDSIQLSKMNPD